jgi:hypothetical protein
MVETGQSQDCLEWLSTTVTIFWTSLFMTGKKCVVCSTLNVFKSYRTATRVVRPTALLWCLPQMIRDFVKGSQQYTAEFFQQFWRLLSDDAYHLQVMGLIPRQCSLQFTRSFSILLSSEVLCSECNSVTNNSVTETVVPLPITKVQNSADICMLIKFKLFNHISIWDGQLITTHSA